MTRDLDRRRSSSAEAEAEASPWPGKTTRIEAELGVGGDVASSPGKHAATDRFAGAPAAIAATPARPAGLYGAFMHAYGAGDRGSTGTAPPTSGTAPASGVAASAFEISGWTAGNNPVPRRVGTPDGDETTINVQSDGISASATVRATTPEAQRYAIGFAQTIHHSERRAVYVDGDGRVCNQWLATRGEMLDQRTDLASPAPWYNRSLALGATAKTPAMTDNPTVSMPEYSPEFGLLSRMEGGESFTTYLVAMVGTDASTIVYLGNVRWNINWSGRFDEGYHTFSGATAHVGGAARASTGSAVLSGPAANDGAPGRFVGSSGGGGRRRGSHAYAWGTYGHAIDPLQRYGNDPPAAETDEQRNARLRAAIVAPLRGIIDDFERSPTPATIDRARLTVFTYLFDRANTQLTTLTTYLSSVRAAQLLLDAVVEVDHRVTADRQNIDAIERAIANVIGGGNTDDATGVCMVAYQRLSVPARRFLQTRPLVDQLQGHTRSAEPPRGAQLTMAPGRSGGSSGTPLPSPARAIYDLVHGDMTGALALTSAPPPAAGAADTTVPPEVRSAFETLKARVLHDIPAPAADAPAPTYQHPGADRAVITALQQAIREADSRVRDLLARDTEVQSRLMLALNVTEMTGLNSAMDSVSELVNQCYPPPTGGGTRAPVDRFALIRDFLAARPGAENAELRRRVLANGSLGTAINGLTEEQRATILRLVARGTATAEPVDTIYAAARNQATADESLAAAIQLGQDTTRLGTLSSDVMFRQALESERNRARASASGLTISVRDYLYRAWGQAPDVGGDPASALSQPWVNPTGTPEAPQPPTPEQLEQIGTIMTRTINTLAPRLTSWGWFDGLTQDQPIVDALLSYERDTALPANRDIFRAANLAPGPELVRRANQDSRIRNLQDRLYRCISEENRQTAERVLGLRADASAIGQVGSQVRLADDDRGMRDGQQHVPLAQALHEITTDREARLAEITVASGTPLGQLIRAAAQDLCRELNETFGADSDDITRLNTNYTAAFDAKRVELAAAVGLQGTVTAQQMLNNAYRELPDGRGDLRAHMQASLASRSAGFERDLIPPEPGPPPSLERFRAPGEALWSAVTAYYDPGYGGLISSNDPTNDRVTEITNTRGERVGPVRTALDAALHVDQAPAAPVQAASTGTAGPPRPGAPPGTAVAAPAGDAPSTMAAWYRQTYGIEPERHVIELARHTYVEALARVREHNEWVEGLTRARREAEHQTTVAEPSLASIAELFGLPPGHIDMATPAQPPASLAGATHDDQVQIDAAADRLWAAVRGDGDIVAVRTSIDGQRTAQREAILAAFRVRSGGIDLDFYLRQAQQHVTQLGGEGARTQGQAVGSTTASLYGDQGSITETLALTQTGQVGFLVRIETALGNSNRNELFRILDNASPDDRRSLLGNTRLLAMMRTQLGAADYDRAYGTLNGTATLATRLRSRSDGSTDDTDASGLTAMQRDIRDWVARRTEWYTREREAQRSTLTDEQIRDRVRAELRQQYADPALQSIIDDECNHWWRGAGEAADLQGRILNGGEQQHTSVLLGAGVWTSSDQVITQINQMNADERSRLRTDPEFLRRLDAFGPTPLDRRRIFDALRGSADSADDHLGALMTLVDGTGSADEILAALGRLNQTEYTTLRRDPALVNRLLGKLRYDDRALASARQMLSFDPAATEGRLGITGSNFASNPIPGEITPDERTRLAFLQHQAASMIRGGAYRSYDHLLPEAVSVYRMDFRPHAEHAPDPAPAAAAPAGETQAQARRRLLARTPADDHALELRQHVWTTELQTVVRECIQRDTDAGDATVTHRTEVIERAVKGTEDPSGALLAWNSQRPWWGGAGDREGVLATIRNASPQIIVDEWSSVRHRAFGSEPADAGGPDPGTSMERVYGRYRTLRDSTDASDEHRTQVDQARIAFQRYAIRPSLAFESVVLPSTEGVFTSHSDPGLGQTQTVDQNNSRDNPNYMEFRRTLYERISSLDSGLIARTIGADGADAALIGSGVRTAEQGLASATEAHGQLRTSGSTTIASDEGRQMDRAMGDYHRAVQGAEDATAGGERGADGTFADISARSQRDIAQVAGDFEAQRANFQQAREKAAETAAIIVGVLVGVLLTVLVPGPGSVAAMAFYSAMVSAAAATGQVLTREAILGNTYDASGEGIKTIAVAAATGAIAGGAQYYSGQLVNALMPLRAASTTAAEQATALAAGLNRGSPAVWQTIIRQGGQQMVQTSITGMASTAGSMVDPNNWLHGWNEGWYRARDAGAAQLRALPGSIIRSAVTAMATAAVSHGVERAGLEAPDPAAVGQAQGVGRVAQQLVHDLPGNIASGVAEQTMQAMLGSPQTPDAFLRAVLTSVAQSSQDMGQGMMGGTVAATAGQRSYETRQRMHLARELSAHRHDFVTGDEPGLFYRAVMNTPNGSALPTAAEFLAARNSIAGSQATGDLTPAQRDAYQRWVRQGVGPEFQARQLRNPLEVPEVVAAATRPPAPIVPVPTSARGQAAHSRVEAVRQAATEVRTARSDVDLAEFSYLGEPTPAAATRALEQATQARERARAALERARAARDEATRMLDQAANDAERTEIQAQIDEANRQVTAAEEENTTLLLTRARLQTFTITTPLHDTTGTPPADPAARPTTDGTAPPPQREAPIRATELSPEQYLELHSLIQQHGQEEGSRRFREAQQRRQDSATGEDITASIVQGSDFIGRGRALPADEAGQARMRAEVIEQAQRHLGEPAIWALIPGIARVEGGTRIVLADGTSFQIRITTADLGEGVVARSLPNTEAGVHNIQLNERIAPENIRRALAHELAELASIQRQTIAGAVPVTADALGSGAFVPGSQLSPHDAGRVGELVVLVAELGEAGSNITEAMRLRREIAALIEHLGLRQEGTAQQIADARTRLALISPQLGTAGQREIPLLARPRGQLDATDQAGLDQVRQRATEQQPMIDRLAARARPLHEEGELPVAAAEPAPVSLARARAMADQAQTRREARSREVLDAIRSMRPRPGEPYPPAPAHILIGGGASVAALTADTLFIDNMGRWHRDASGEIAQTTQQLGDMPGVGDARTFATEASGRLRLEAVRFMLNNAAAESMCVNGRATLEMDGVHLVLVIRPTGDEGNPVRMLVDPAHIPAIATGFPMERAPRARSGVQPTEAVSRVRTRLAELGIAIPPALAGNAGDNDEQAAAWDRFLRTRVPDPTPPPPPTDGTAPPPPRDVAISELLARGTDRDAQARLEAALATLGVADAWYQAVRTGGLEASRLAGTAPTVLRGDEAAEINFATHPNTSWVISGNGGTAISIAENILRQTATRRPPVRVIMVGRVDSATLGTNTQWRQVMTAHAEPGAFLDAAGQPMYPNGDSRLHLQDADIAGLASTPDGFSVGGSDPAQGVIAAMGRDGLIPGPIAALVSQSVGNRPAGMSAEQALRGEVLNDPLTGAYLGYALIVQTTGGPRRFEITGASSRFLPVPPFTRAQADLYGQESQAPGQRDAPAGAGRFAGGFTASAEQASSYARWRREQEEAGLRPRD